MLKLDWSKFDWQHAVLVIAGAVLAASAAIGEKAQSVCAAFGGAKCATEITSIATSAGAVAGILLLVFGHTSHSLLRRQDGGGGSDSASNDNPRPASVSKPTPKTFQLTSLLALPLLAALAGCGMLSPSNLPTNVPADVIGVTDCVLTALLTNKNVDDCIAKYGAALVSDALQLLLASPQFKQEHPDKVSAAYMALARAQMRLAQP